MDLFCCHLLLHTPLIIMAPLCILREEEQTIDIFSPSVVTVTPFWLLLKIVLTLSFLRHDDGEKCLFWVTHMLVFWGFYLKKYKKKDFLYKATCKTLFTQWIERETHDRPQTVTCKVSCLLKFICSEKATKFYKIFTLLLTGTT